ncbi:MAG TPA: 5-(carboxyamino)imidazole ribonucleotide synthase [Nitrososphaera sp.]|nr:5-(carboxyamino)imidazole ribonucleotide synthase [Nitrososphaera sp.]HEX2169502.1 5-(carboxyamino)imidazole ribonucleotide synthase [Nitrososphaera sp.]
MVNSDLLAVDCPLRVGIIGGGQLGKMLAHEAKRMGLEVVILDPTRECPASSIADEQIVADFKDEDAISRLAEESDVLTYEIELANSVALKNLELRRYPVRPAPETLHVIQNKFRQKSFLRNHKIDVADFEMVTSEDHLYQLCKNFGFPVMLKACENSYDGRGNFLITSPDQVPKAFRYFSNNQIMVEKFVPFTKEISIMVARNPSGDIASFPVAENIHKNSILDMSIVPARIDQETQLKAKRTAEMTMQVLKGSGIFGIEMFVTKNGDVLINEIAPRPHNSGHYTNEACSVSQFEQHLRAVLDLPLIKPELFCPAVMVNILGKDHLDGPYVINGLKQVLSVPGVKMYVYGKRTTKPGRKLGHITATGTTVEDALMRATKARAAIELTAKMTKESSE